MFLGVTFIEGGLYTQTQTYQMQNTIEAARINWEGEEKNNFDNVPGASWWWV